MRDILESVAARWAIEEHFHDVKEVWGAGQQQVRNVWLNIGCWHLNGWMYALVELCCWDMDKTELVDRRLRSWDNTDRRPSHADRRRYFARQMLENKSKCWHCRERHVGRVEYLGVGLDRACFPTQTVWAAAIDILPEDRGDMALGVDNPRSGAVDRVTVLL